MYKGKRTYTGVGNVNAAHVAEFRACVIVEGGIVSFIFIPNCDLDAFIFFCPVSETSDNFFGDTLDNLSDTDTDFADSVRKDTDDETGKLVNKSILEELTSSGDADDVDSDGFVHGLAEDTVRDVVDKVVVESGDD